MIDIYRSVDCDCGDDDDDSTHTRRTKEALNTKKKCLPVLTTQKKMRRLSATQEPLKISIDEQHKKHTYPEIESHPPFLSSPLAQQKKILKITFTFVFL